jgi:N-acyl homoserine lactone hydrolase
LPEQRSNHDYRVTAVKLGTLSVDASGLVLGRDPGRAVDIPVWGAAVEGHGLKILIDTGIRDPAWVSDRLGPCSQDEGETIVGALDLLGWRPSDVDVVINTHLHYDHCGNNAWFPAAPIYVSAAEWDAAQQPVSTQMVLYEPHEWEDAPLSVFNYQMVTGDYTEVKPGIKIIQTPGHSVGHQSVLIQTADGIVCVTGDAVNCEENFTLRTPGAVVVSVPDALASIEKIRRNSTSVLMSHDARVTPGQSDGFPAVPPAARASAGCC